MKRTNCLLLAVTTVLLAACGGGDSDDVQVDCTSYQTSNSTQTTCRQTGGDDDDHYSTPSGGTVVVNQQTPQVNSSKALAAPGANTDYTGIPLPDAPPTTKVTEPQVDFMAYVLSAPASDTHLCSARRLEVQGIGMEKVELVEAGNVNNVYAEFEIGNNGTYASTLFDPTTLPNGTLMVQIIAEGSGKSTVVMPTREWHQSYKIWPCDSPGRQTAGNP